MNSEFLTRDKAAKYILERYGLPCAKKTLEKWAVIGGGPRFVRCGARVLYSPLDIDAWMKARTSGPMASTSALKEGVRLSHGSDEPQDINYLNSIS